MAVEPGIEYAAKCHKAKRPKLKRCAGKQFDPTVVEVFIDINMQPPQTKMEGENDLCLDN